VPPFYLLLGSMSFGFILMMLSDILLE